MLIKYYSGPCQSHLGHLYLPVKSLRQMKPDTLLKRQFRPFWTHFGAKISGFWAMGQKQELVYWTSTGVP